MRRVLSHEVIDVKNSPEVREETPSGVVTMRSSGISGESRATTADRVGLAPIDIFRVNETSVDEDTLRGELTRGVFDPPFGLVSPCSSAFALRECLEGDTCSPVATLKKSFHNPDGPLYKVPRTRTGEEFVKASVGRS